MTACVAAWPGLVARTTAARRAAVEIEIADEIEQLVPDGLVGGERRTGGEHAVLADHDDALRRDVRGEAARQELADLVLEAEGARDGDALAKVVGIAAPARLLRDAGVVEVDPDLERHVVAARHDASS